MITRHLTIGLFVVVVAAGSLAQAQTTIYVDADADAEPHDGSDWCHAYLGLDDALADALGDPSVTTIRVAEGTYKPTVQTEPGTPRTEAFQLINGVTLEGGYAGCGAADPDERDIALHETILSGDLNGDDQPDWVNRSDNSYHVFYHPWDLGLDATAVIDGFTITAGNANYADSPHYSGGGMYNKESSPTVINCTFSGNSAGRDGGGMMNAYDSDPVVDSCTFTGNSATYGGGMNSTREANPVVSNCRFSGNSASDGGGIYNKWNSPTVINCTFTGNSANNGGGLYNDDSDPAVAGCTFTGNSGNTGGGMYNEASDVALTNCILWGNIATTSPEIFSDIYTPTITYSCVQDGLGQPWFGSGCLDADPLFVDADGPDNVFGTYDDDLHLLEGSPCINTGDPAADYTGQADLDGEDRVQQCRVDMGADETPYYLDCNNNAAGDACDILEGTSDDCNYNSVPDECDIAGVTSEDTNGDGIPDECQLIHNVTQDTYHFVMQCAIEDALNGDEIHVGPGTFHERINMLGKAITLLGTGGPDVTIIDGDQGGTVITCDSGEGPETVIEGFTIANGLAERGGGMYNYQSSPTVTNCTFSGNEAAADDYHSFGGGMYNEQSNPTVANCTFLGNAATAETEDGFGGGMYNEQSGPTVSNCTFTGNSADYGGGIYNDVSDSGVYDCTFSGNSADLGGGLYNFVSNPGVGDCAFTGNSAWQGGGMYNDASHPAIYGCTFTENSVTGQYATGGGICNTSSSPTVSNCVFSQNSAVNLVDARGGGMSNHDGDPILFNCTFDGNFATYGGGGMHNEESSPWVIDCTFNGNSADERGGGIYNYESYFPRWVDCTISGNSSHYGGGMYSYSFYSATVTNCTFTGNSATVDGGGMYNDLSSPSVTGCEFTGNSAGDRGGATYGYGSNPELANCTFSGNSAAEGGGMYNETCNGTTVWNCTFSGNVAGVGSGTCNAIFSDLTVTNCIFWDGGDEIWNDNDSTVTVAYSCVQDGTGQPWFVHGCLDADPLFVDADGPDDVFGTDDDDLHLLEGSPCINTGDPEGDYTDQTDIDGEDRVQQCRVDMGADETPYYLDCNENTIADACDILEATSGDCNYNSVPDECDIAGGTSNDSNDNGVPDECELKRPMAEDCATIPPGDRCSASGTCTTDNDCAYESHCVLPPALEAGDGVCYAPKARYLSLAAHPEQFVVTAWRVRLDDGTVLGWVGGPYWLEPTSEHDGLWVANVQAAPAYEITWPTLVHVIGCEIGHTSLCDDSTGEHCGPNNCPGGPSETCYHHCYQIQAIMLGADIGDESNYSEALTLCTPSVWGDTVSTCAGNVCRPPNGVVGLDDVQAEIKYYQHNEVAPITWLDIAPSNGEAAPDQNIGIADILKVIDGFQGRSYPGSGPSSCP